MDRGIGAWSAGQRRARGPFSTSMTSQTAAKRKASEPEGGGQHEPAAAVVPAAIANAVFDTVRARLRAVPFTPAKVLAAIQGA